MNADSQGAFPLAEAQLSFDKNMRIDIRLHFLRELVAERQIIVKYVPSAEQHADVLAKPLTSERFRYTGTR